MKIALIKPHLGKMAKEFDLEIDDVVREIERCGLKHVLFVDDNVTAKKTKQKSFFKELKNLKIKQANKQFYSINSIIKRSFDKKTNMKALFNFALYYGYNILFSNTNF
ncbi:MAG: hypothetical protein JXB50_07235 [Spirochaetes bacterium]|nr:hypothetical protein [Spirochaetota bacterium]